MFQPLVSRESTWCVERRPEVRAARSRLGQPHRRGTPGAPARPLGWRPAALCPAATSLTEPRPWASSPSTSGTGRPHACGTVPGNKQEVWATGGRAPCDPKCSPRPSGWACPSNSPPPLDQRQSRQGSAVRSQNHCPPSAQLSASSAGNEGPPKKVQAVQTEAEGHLAKTRPFPSSPAAWDFRSSKTTQWNKRSMGCRAGDSGNSELNLRIVLYRLPQRMAVALCSRAYGPKVAQNLSQHLPNSLQNLHESELHFCSLPQM